MSGQMAVERRPLANGTRDAHIRCERGMLGAPLRECNNKQIGSFGEELASFYLEECGLEILERNWTCRFGEADIIARDADTIVLVEVKTRVAKERFGAPLPELAVNSRKRAKYEKLALMYMARQSSHTMVRFDVIAVRLASERDSYLHHLVGAFEWDE